MRAKNYTFTMSIENAITLEMMATRLDCTMVSTLELLITSVEKRGTNVMFSSEFYHDVYNACMNLSSSRLRVMYSFRGHDDFIEQVLQRYGGTSLTRAVNLLIEEVMRYV